ncbi:MAG: SIMPL domain-containing protein [Actinomycetota bacterium]|nr:SIMPL domain-containing protein [Actinomycetota bacterium]
MIPNQQQSSPVPADDGAPQVTVTGRGACSQVPDKLTISIGIETRRDTVPAAYAGAATAVQAILRRLQTLGVAADDTTSSALNVRAETNWQEGAGNVVSGYLVSSSFAVRLDYRANARDQSAQDVIVATVEAGGNDVRLNGLQPSVSDPAQAAARARELAWADAASKAEHFAALAGRAIGPVLIITEGEPAAVGPSPVPVMARALNTEAIPLEAGESTVEAAVTVSWELI